MERGLANNAARLVKRHYTTALYTTPLYCTALHCTALNCTLQHYTALHCNALHCTVHYNTTLHTTTLYCPARYSSVIYCAVMYNVLHRPAPQCRFHYFSARSYLSNELRPYGPKIWRTQLSSKEQNSAVQCSAVQCSTVQCSIGQPAVWFLWNVLKPQRSPNTRGRTRDGQSHYFHK